jgi:hypothetical protein
LVKRGRTAQLLTPEHAEAQAAAAPSVGILNEGPLHASLRASYLEPGDQTEVRVDGYIVDILRGDLIIEIQTRNFSAIATKLRRLVERHRVLLVHPVPCDLWIVKMPREPGGATWRRHGWVTTERRLIRARETVSLRRVLDYASMLPATLPGEFLTADLASAIARPRRVAQQMAYCLRKGGCIEKTGASGNAIVYARSSPA